MGKKSPSAPTPPDPIATANAQGASDLKTAVAERRMNNTNQYTPYGSLEYNWLDTDAYGVPRYEAVQTLSPAEQQKLDLGNQAAIRYGEIGNQQLNQVSDRLSSPLDFSSFGPSPTANEETRQSVLNSTLQRFQPQLDQDREALDARLANQGITLGSQAYNSEQDRLQRGVNDFRLAANVGAGNEMAQLFELESRARGQQMNEAVQERQTPLNELAALFSGNQVQSPNFVPTAQTNLPQVPLADSIYGSYNAELNNFNQAQQRQSAERQGLYSLLGAGASAFAFSDRRLKTGIYKVGKLANGLAVYAYHYIWGGPLQVGLMADEVKALRPEAVINVGGYDAVNYAEAVL